VTKPSGGDAVGGDKMYVRKRERKEAFKSFLESGFKVELLPNQI
jgi:hypothetical protein